MANLDRVNPIMLDQIIRQQERIDQLTAERDSSIRAEKYQMELIARLEAERDALKDFCIWLTGCGYDFTQHPYFIEQRDKLLKSNDAMEKTK